MISHRPNKRKVMLLYVSVDVPRTILSDEKIYLENDLISVL